MKANTAATRHNISGFSIVYSDNRLRGVPSIPGGARSLLIGIAGWLRPFGLGHKFARARDEVFCLLCGLQVSYYLSWSLWGNKSQLRKTLIKDIVKDGACGMLIVKEVMES